MRGTPYIPHEPEAEGFPHTSHTGEVGHGMPARRDLPMTHRPRPQGQAQHPVFIDNSGWRRKLSRLLAVAVGGACIGYLMLIAVLVGGLWQPAGSQPPGTTGPLPAGDARPAAGKPSPAPGGAQRIDAPRVPGSAERPGDRHSRTPPSARSEGGAPHGSGER
ncbi:hypothetical protein GCM10010361_12510 [Streptomyces olivaceiscleroticus]|uniref:Translation initiation factor IF-2 n=1 Tax=Streptomyces olivaceiscleroticus TaxID=68245 RepID=A0ABN0ZKV0_9ACTN